MQTLEQSTGTATVQTSAVAATVKPGRKGRGNKPKPESTPRSMIPPNAAAAQSNSAPAVGQSAPQIDYPQIVRDVATRKAGIGETFVGKQGKQHLFAGACAKIKSLLGMDKTAHLEPVHTDGILDAMRVFWNGQIDRLKTYGEIRSASWDKPTAEAIKDDAGKVTGFKPKLNARIHAQKDCRDAQESALMLDFTVKQQAKRVDYMQGIVTPGGNQSTAGTGKFERAEIDAAKAKLVLLEKSRDAQRALITPAPVAS